MKRKNEILKKNGLDHGWNDRLHELSVAAWCGDGR